MRFAFVLLTSLALFAQALPEKVWTALTTTGTTSSYATGGTDKHTVQVVVTGSPSGCSVKLEGSLDDVSYFDVSGAQTCTSSVMFHVVDRPVAFVRNNLSTLTGGTAPTVTLRYLGTRSGGRQ